MLYLKFSPFCACLSCIQIFAAAVSALLTSRINIRTFYYGDIDEFNQEKIDKPDEINKDITGAGITLNNKQIRLIVTQEETEWEGLSLESVSAAEAVKERGPRSIYFYEDGYAIVDRNKELTHAVNNELGLEASIFKYGVQYNNIAIDGYNNTTAKINFNYPCPFKITPMDTIERTGINPSNNKGQTRYGTIDVLFDPSVYQTMSGFVNYTFELYDNVGNKTSTNFRILLVGVGANIDILDDDEYIPVNTVYDNGKVPAAVVAITDDGFIVNPHGSEIMMYPETFGYFNKWEHDIKGNVPVKSGGTKDIKVLLDEANKDEYRAGKQYSNGANVDKIDHMCTFTHPYIKMDDFNNTTNVPKGWLSNEWGKGKLSIIEYRNVSGLDKYAKTISMCNYVVPAALLDLVDITQFTDGECPIHQTSITTGYKVKKHYHIGDISITSTKYDGNDIGEDGMPNVANPHAYKFTIAKDKDAICMMIVEPIPGREIDQSPVRDYILDN